MSVKIYCSGIGGIGLSAYASHMRAAGHAVWGSDRAQSPTTRALEEQGIQVIFNQDGSGLPKNIDLFVYSEAIPSDAPERKEAEKRGIRMFSYFRALGELTAGKNLIAVCGTHGKSSTTAMAAKVLMDAGKDPNVVVGTKMRELGERNWRRGKTDLWVVEACEYRRSFHYLSPRTILLTNADGDHFDAFRDMAEYTQAFVEFLKKLPPSGVVITHGQVQELRTLVTEAGRKLVDADTQPLTELSTPGLHMQQNAQLVLALGEMLGIPIAVTQSSLRNYGGVWRRLEMKGTLGSGVTVVDDYAHHPVEIRATLKAMCDAYPDRRIVCVFQPHTHDRTLKLWKEFSLSFSDAGLVIIPNVYDARPDRDSERVSVPSLVQAIAEGSGVRCINGISLSATETRLKKELLKNGDVLVVMGAGNVTDLAASMVR